MTEKSKGMRCPTDGADLVMSERAGIEIDFCPICRGVWLDRGELDKIVERSARDFSDSRRQAPQREDIRNVSPSYAPAEHGHSQPRRRRSFLEDLFD